MKKIASVLVAFMTLASVTLLAGPPAGGWHKEKTLSTLDDFAALVPGDQVAQVCKKCDTVSVVDIQSKEQAMDFCEEGATIDCPSCGNASKVVRSAPPSRGLQKIKFVDDHGEACMFMAKLEPKTSSDFQHGHK
ncbi:hypothetical protein [Cerasicoccus fimbriatus]|uniref:hypothetical protein n=1 Tax=Cerasicoccus fimbriatus TaxID=3014554 RepID=UPI0022B5C85C|nr:hypothetical protein [Cerasicoccus sp. TK19100]